MSAVSLEILIILLLMVGNGVFAMSEIAMVTARKSRLQHWANEGNAQARTALELANAPNRFLSTVQIGITLVGILAGALGGATIAERLAAVLSRVSWLAAYSHAISVAVIVLSITYLSLVVGELVPKRLALHSPERIACAVAGPLRALSVITAPIVHLLSASTDAVLRVLGIRPSAELPLTHEEIAVLIEQAGRAGVFEETEQDMVEGVLRLNNRHVGALATPRTDIAWLPVDAPAEQIQQQMTTSPHDRFPVCEGDLDNVVGVVRTRELLMRSLAREPVDLRSLSHPPLFVPETMLASKALQLLKECPVHLALVIDEYGGLQGMVTINDIVEEIVGDIEPDSPQATRRKDGSWLVDGMLPVHEFKEIFHVKRLPGEERNNFQTLGGFVLMRLGRVPVVADQFRWGSLRFEVVDMDGNRVDKVLVTPLKPDAGENLPPSPPLPMGEGAGG
jgi:magnesium and cobalt exporter, CNNM family